MLLLLLALLSAPAPASAADDCAAPTWYTSLPRDREYYYGVARATDTEAARQGALRNLAKQVTGEIEGWPTDKVAEVAGPCRDKWEVAASVGRLLPSSSLLSGWEQDGFESCGANRFVLVRVEKDRVERFVRGSDRFKKEVVAGLTARVAKVESDLAALTARVERLEKGLSALPADAGKADAAKAVAEARAGLKSGRPAAEVAKAVARAEDEFSKLEERLKGYQAGHDAAEDARLAALKKEKAPELARRRAVLDSGKWGFPDAAAIVGIYNDEKDYEGLRRFSRELLARPDAAKLDGHQDFVAYMGLVGDLSLNDDAATLKDGEAFLKAYPRSDMFSAVKAQMDGRIALARMRRNAPAAAPAAPPAPGPDPCAER